MALLGNNTNGTSSPLVAKIANVGGSASIRAAHTLAARVRWSTTTATTDLIAVALGANADASGTYLGRKSTTTGTKVTAWRADSFYLSFDQAISTNGFSSTTAWVHLCVTYDTTNIRLYVDGVLEATTASAAANTSATTAATNNLASCAGMRGDVCDVFGASRALSAAEVFELSHVRQPNVLRGGNCFAWVPMATAGAGAGSTVAYVGQDYSGQRNHLTAQAGTGTAPAVSNVSPPVPYFGVKPRRIYVPSSTVALAGSLDSVSSLGGSLATSKPLAGSMGSISALQGQLAAVKPLAGSLGSVSALDGQLSTAKQLTGSLGSVSALQGTLAQLQALSGSLGAVSSLSGQLSTGKPLTGNLGAVSAFDGVLRQTLAFAGSAAAVSAFQGVLSLNGLNPLLGSLGSVSALQGGLSVSTGGRSGARSEARRTLLRRGTYALTTGRRNVR